MSLAKLLYGSKGVARAFENLIIREAKARSSSFASQEGLHELIGAINEAEKAVTARQYRLASINRMKRIGKTKNV